MLIITHTQHVLSAIILVLYVYTFIMCMIVGMH